MAAHVYPDPRVSRYINNNFVSVQFNVKEDIGAPIRYKAFWTPCIMVRDVDDNEYRRSFGSLDVDHFLAELSMGIALRYYNSGQFDESVGRFEEALEFTRVEPYRHAENIYWLAAARYESESGDVDDLLNTWEDLRRQHPDSEWANKTRWLVTE